MESRRTGHRAVHSDPHVRSGRGPAAAVLLLCRLSGMFTVLTNIVLTFLRHRASERSTDTRVLCIRLSLWQIGNGAHIIIKQRAQAITCALIGAHQFSQISRFPLPRYAPQYNVQPQRTRRHLTAPPPLRNSTLTAGILPSFPPSTLLHAGRQYGE